MTYYEREEGGKIVPVTGEVPEEAIRLMESMDDRAVIQRMTTGIAGDAFIYRYPIKTKMGTKEIIGISTDGAYELAKTHIRNLETLSDFRVDKDTDPDYIYASVRVRSHATNVTLLGVGRQCKFMVDSGNVPIRDRLNEHAFVSAISKAQRNGILHHADQMVIAEIIDTWSKTGKSKQLRPPILETEAVSSSSPTVPSVVATSPTKPTEVAIAEQQEKLKRLRMEVHNRFQTDIGIGVEKRKEMLKTRFGKESLTDLSEKELKECKSWVEEMIEQRSKVVQAPLTKIDEGAKQVTELGFADVEEQGKLRGTLYSMLTSPTQLGFKQDEAKKFISDRGYTTTTEIPKDSLLKLIHEAGELIKAKSIPTEF